MTNKEKIKKAPYAHPYAYGGIAEQESKRQIDYDGNEKENEDMEKFAHGGKVKGMADHDKMKQAIVAIISKLKKKPEGAESEAPTPEMGEGAEEETPEGEMKAHEEGKIVAAGEMMDALKSGDKTAFARSLENFMEMCEY